MRDAPALETHRPGKFAPRLGCNDGIDQLTDPEKMFTEKSPEAVRGGKPFTSTTGSHLKN
jgi:hypothetical protein